jgi:hypothetical protein
MLLPEHLIFGIPQFEVVQSVAQFGNSAINPASELHNLADQI